MRYIQFLAVFLLMSCMPTPVSTGTGGMGGTSGAATSASTSASSADSSSVASTATSGSSSGGVVDAGMDAPVCVLGTTTDCDVCGHDCLGGACVAGACQPTIFATNQPGAKDIVLDAASVYWISNGEAISKPKSGSGLPGFIGGPSVGDLHVSATLVYSENLNAQGGVATMPIGGGPLSHVAGTSSTGGTAGIASPCHRHRSPSPSSRHSLHRSLSKVPLGGGTATVLAANQTGPQSVVVNSSNVYWTNLSGNISTVPIFGGAVKVIGASQDPGAIALDADYVYWTDHNAGIVYRASLGGLGMAPIATGQVGPVSLALDGADIYWCSAVGVMRGTILGAAPVSVWSSPTGATSVAVDASSVWWSTPDAIWRLAK